MKKIRISNRTRIKACDRILKRKQATIHAIMDDDFIYGTDESLLIGAVRSSMKYWEELKLMYEKESKSYCNPLFS